MKIKGREKRKREREKKILDSNDWTSKNLLKKHLNLINL